MVLINCVHEFMHAGWLPGTKESLRAGRYEWWKALFPAV
jgi:hypothetical protein